MHRRFLRFFAPFLLLILISVPAHARDWLRAESDNFIVYSDGFPLELERWVTKVERFDLLLRQRFGLPERRERNRLTIYMLEDAKLVGKFVGRSNIAGFYSHSSEGSFAITNRKPAYYDSELSGEMSLYHEYAHHFMYRNYPAAYPAWFREGFAEYASTATFAEDGSWTFGHPPVHRLKALRKRSLPIEKILFSDVSAIDNDERPAFYAWSWLLVHMLNSDRQRAQQLRTYLQRFQDGASKEEAARIFGDLGLLQRQLRAYGTADLRYQSSARPIAYNGMISVTALDPVASRLAELRLARRANPDKLRARDALRRLAETAPDNAEVLVELALAEVDAAKERGSTDTIAAETAVNRALEIDPGHGRGNLLRATLSIQRLTADRNPDPAAWNAARDRIALALKRDPDDPYALLSLFRSYLAQAMKPPPIAYRAIGNAFALQPEATDIRLSYGFSLAFRGSFDKADTVLQVLASDPHASAIGNRALVVLDRLRKAGVAPSLNDLESETDRQPVLF